MANLFYCPFFPKQTFRHPETASVREWDDVSGKCSIIIVKIVFFLCIDELDIAVIVNNFAKAHLK